MTENSMALQSHDRSASFGSLETNYPRLGRG